jgi:NAD(P)-dependent dehydrogenase (short-subunit alcohol dehydrogenase family)
MQIAGRNALITGAAHRVGKALTLALAAAGANVYVHYNRSAELAEATAAEARAMGVQAEVGQADLSDPRVASLLIENAQSTLGNISILVNSASGFPRDRFQSVGLDEWRAAQDLTLAGPVFLTQAFTNALAGDMTGAVVNVTDVKTATPYREHFSYIVAKGGLDTFTRAAALALAPRIRVNAVALGIVLPPPGQGEDYVERLASKVPMRKPGGTEPVAQAVLALLENDFITGEIVRLDGGGHLAGP